MCIVCEREDKLYTYEGETGRSLYIGGSQHLEGYNKKDMKDPMWAHCVLEHGGTKVDFWMEDMGSFRKPLARAIDEGIRINRAQGQLMNTRGEWRQSGVSRPSFSRE